MARIAVVGVTTGPAMSHAPMAGRESTQAATPGAQTRSMTKPIASRPTAIDTPSTPTRFAASRGAKSLLTSIGTRLALNAPTPSEARPKAAAMTQKR